MSERETDTTLIQLIADNAAAFGPERAEGIAMPTGAILLAEWVDIDGDRWFTTFASDAEGHMLPTWRSRGLASEFLEQLRIRQIVANLPEE